jgi:glutathione S-transferase
MSLTLYYHPLSSYCMKALVALYENDTPFTPHLVDLGDERASAEFKKLWPIGKFPVLRDAAKDRTVPESSIIIEYLAQHYPGKTQLVPADPELARQVRFHDRFFDLHVHEHMGKIVTDRLRPAGKNDTYGVEQARAKLATTCAMIDQAMTGKTLSDKPWVMGDSFTMGDCAAAPALFYANMVLPLADTYRNTAAYLNRLTQRPSFARALKEAEPYFKFIPK